MKLELKNIAPYLPYGLNLMFEKSGRIINMQSCYNEGSLHITDSNEGNTYNLSIWNFNPILRPLSQLTEIIEHNGEKFVPIERLTESENGVTLSKYRLDNGETNTVLITYKLMGDTFTDFVTNRGNVNSTRYEYVVKLLEWHFDVFNLIENNLAIAVTDELNPYK